MLERTCTVVRSKFCDVEEAIYSMSEITCTVVKFCNVMMAIYTLLERTSAVDRMFSELS